MKGFNRFRFLRVLSLLVLSSFFWTGCEKDSDDPRNPNRDGIIDHGFITTVELVFTPQDDTLKSVSFLFSDPDGPGGLPPIRVDTITLSSGSVWNCSIKLWDESDPANPVDITYQFRLQDQDHIVCFDASAPLQSALQIERTDTDGTYEVGLESSWTTLEPSAGSVQVTIKHQVGLKDGTCIPGSTDVEVVFPVRINPF